MRTVLLYSILFFSYNVYSQSIPLKIEVGNLRNSDGSIIVNVFKDQKGFEDDTEVIQKIFSKKEHMKDGTFKAEIFLPPGTYGVALLDDENDSGEMNYTFIGIPKEGYGFSNFYHTGLKMPTFSDFSFNLSEITGILKIRIRYM
jgi:uncharacterized protein (DUF2141 family)